MGSSEGYVEGKV